MAKFEIVTGLFVAGVKDFRWTNDLEKFLKQYPLAGLALFNSPFDSPDNIWKDREASLEAVYEFLKKLPPTVKFLAADQEGGRVRRLRGAYLPLPSAQKIFEACDSPGMQSKAQKLYRLAAQQMALSQIHVNFAPVCDLRTKTSSNVVGDRSYSENAGDVIHWSSLFIDAFESQNVHTTLKHFPGHGPSEFDSHQQIAVLTKTAREMMASDTQIFVRLAAQASAVMTAHIAFADEPDRIFSIDSELQKPFRRLLPDHLAWFTDDLAGMKAVSDRDPWLKAFDCQYDHILVCGSLADSARAIEDTIRHAEKSILKFSDEESLEKRIQKSHHRFHTRQPLGSFTEWKANLLKIEREGLQTLEELNIEIA